MKKTIFLLFLVVMDTGRSMNIESSQGSVCERITISMCQGIGYNYTMFPNMFNHRTQNEARFEIRHYIPLVDWVCYKWLPRFLCSMYAPMCTNTSVIIPPCRSLCERSMQRCLPLVYSFGEKWPSKFNCSNFPEEGNGKMCIAEDTNIKDLTSASTKQHANSTKIYSRQNDADRKCRSDQFQCTNYDRNHEMCIPKNWRCDGMNDCKDSSDEASCSSRTTTRLPPSTQGPTVGPSCQRISVTISGCNKRLGYSYTRLPNRFGHINQDQINQALGTWSKAIRKHCSPLLEDFLCRVYIPPCDNDQTKIPCRSVCKKVKKSCRRVLRRLKIKWPSSMRCNKLPKKKCYGAINKRISRKKVKLYKDSCQKITLPMCQGIGYNYSKLPNTFNHHTLAEVDIEVYQYLPLIEVKCSRFLRIFLCSLYLPICTKTTTPIPPCRSLCEHSRRGCEPLMKKYGFGWPAKFRCSNFPKFGDDICVI